MSEIHERLTLLCPIDDVHAAAEHYLGTLPLEDGKRVITLHATVGDLTVTRKADLELKHQSAHRGYEIMNIAWRPHDGGLYPTFAGTLCVEEEGGNFSRIDLDGSYVPPLGLAGMAFDKVLGHHIALEVARELLNDIRLGLELAFQTGETVPGSSV